jgi:N-acetylmuramoyl-L-alanine amidase
MTHEIQNWINDYPGIWEQRPLAQIKYIGICHTASRLDGSSLRQICNDINSWHKSNGWPCISYHFVISEDGEIAQTNDIDASSYTVGNANPETVCVCLDGNFEVDQPTNKQLQALDWLLNELAFNHPEFPASQGDVYGDNELGSATSCPGKNMKPFVKEWRQTGKFSIFDFKAVVPTVSIPLPIPKSEPIPIQVKTPKAETLTPIEALKSNIDYSKLTKIISGLLLVISPLLVRIFGVNIDQFIPELTLYILEIVSAIASIILLFTNPNLRK